jgi:hypothetical protein
MLRGAPRCRRRRDSMLSISCSWTATICADCRSRQGRHARRCWRGIVSKRDGTVDRYDSARSPSPSPKERARVDSSCSTDPPMAHSPATVKFCGQCGSVLATRWLSNHRLMAYQSRSRGASATFADSQFNAKICERWSFNPAGHGWPAMFAGEKWMAKNSKESGKISASAPRHSVVL